MIYGSINSQNLISSLTWNDKFKTALDYLMDLDDNSKLGTTQIFGDDFYLNVHTYQTKSEEHCLFESHRKWIDIQYMFCDACPLRSDSEVYMLCWPRKV